MKKLVFIFLALSCCYGFSNAQDAKLINKNLSYINQQFAQYNDYETFFDIDFTTKEIICEDKFGYLRVAATDIEFRVDGNNVGIYCKDGSTCLQSYQKDGTRSSSDYDEYTMGLREDGKIISHIDEVMDDFNEIIIELGGTVTTTTTNVTTNITTSDDDDIYTRLARMNQIYAEHNQFKCRWDYNASTKMLTRSSEYCVIYIPINKGVSIEYYERGGGGDAYGYQLTADSEVIREKCTSFDNYTKNTKDFVNDKELAKVVVNDLTAILSNTSIADNSSYQADLDYVNRQFAQYNAYNTSFSINTFDKTLVMTNQFGENTLSLSDVEVRIDYSNNWIGLYCKSGTKCITQTSSGSTYNYNQYTMSLNKDNRMIDHIETVKNRLNEAIYKALND